MQGAALAESTLPPGAIRGILGSSAWSAGHLVGRLSGAGRGGRLGRRLDLAGPCMPQSSPGSLSAHP